MHKYGGFRQFQAILQQAVSKGIQGRTGDLLPQAIRSEEGEARTVWLGRQTQGDSGLAHSNRQNKENGRSGSWLCLRNVMSGIFHNLAILDLINSYSLEKGSL